MDQIAQFIIDATAKITPLLIALMKARSDKEKAVIVREIQACQAVIIAKLRDMESARESIVAQFAEYETRQRELDEKLKAVELKANEPPRWG